MRQHVPTRSTKSDLHVELCNECHPFYTGKQKLVDTGGRIERFQRRYGAKGKNPRREELTRGALRHDMSSLEETHGRAGEGARRDQRRSPSPDVAARPRDASATSRGATASSSDSSTTWRELRGRTG